MTEASKMPPRLRRAEAAEYLKGRHGISRTVGTLAKLAVTGGGPAFRKIGQRVVLYDVEELDRWAASLLGEPMRSTSDAKSTAVR
jgi:hypothetical protein